MKHVAQTITSWLRTKQFFYVILGLFVVEAAWISISGRYPMAFDEDFHLGIIQIYAHHISPFFAHQPPNADYFGAVARDPSYLYHYIMSFPWRLMTAVTGNFVAQVIVMRFINIAFFAAGLIIFRKLLLKTKTPVVLVQVALLFFVLTPIVPLVAAQINYDNLLFPLTALSLLLTVKFVRQLQANKSINYVTLMSLLIVCMLTSLVKYAFLPIFATIFFYILFQFYKVFEINQKHVWRVFVSGYHKVVPMTRVWLLLIVILSAGLFMERYGENVVRYRTPLPECNQVLSVTECTAYGAWNRNYLFAISKTHVDWNPVSFTYVWAKKMAFNLMFSINGIYSGFGVGQPLPAPRIAARAVAYIGVPLLFIYARKIFEDKSLRFLLLVTVVYVAALWLQNYTDFIHLGQQVAVQGRYLLPVLLFVYVMIGLAFAQLLKKWPQLKLALAGVATVCLLLGGGGLTYTLHSDSSWYWQNDNLVRVNQDIQRVLDPVIPGGTFVPPA